MKLHYKANDRLTFEIDGEGEKEIFRELAAIQEIFGETKCGMCGSTNLRFVSRIVDDNEYFELRCKDCGAVLAFGQHKKGGTLFPKRKDKEGNRLPNNGWHKWDGNKTETTTTPPPKKK
jgi:hypothetical protein